MAQYLLYRGSHSESRKDVETGTMVPYTYRAREAGNNIVESKPDLAKRWPEKFKSLQDPQAAAAAQASIQNMTAQRRSETGNETPDQRADREKEQEARERAAYEGMTFAELKKHAGEEHINVEHIKNGDKEELIKRILAHDKAQGA